MQDSDWALVEQSPSTILLTTVCSQFNFVHTARAKPLGSFYSLPQYIHSSTSSKLRMLGTHGHSTPCHSMSTVQFCSYRSCQELGALLLLATVRLQFNFVKAAHGKNSGPFYSSPQYAYSSTSSKLRMVKTRGPSTPRHSTLTVQLHQSYAC